MRGAAAAESASVAITRRAACPANACLASRPMMSDGHCRLANGSTGLTPTSLVESVAVGQQHLVGAVEVRVTRSLE